MLFSMIVMICKCMLVWWWLSERWALSQSLLMSLSVTLTV